MMVRGRKILLMTLIFIQYSAPLAVAQPSLSLTRVATGLSSPLFATYAPGDPDHLFIVERGGNIRVLNLSSLSINATPFLTSSQLSAGNGLTSGNERGLLGMAFHPNYEANRRFYVYYTDGSGNTRVRSYQRSPVDPLITDGDSRVEILQFNQPFSNHNGGWIGFGPDGYLYIASGDGGSGNDPFNTGQNKNTLLGKILRISPSTDSASGYTLPGDNPFVGQASVREEIWAYGLRNPWRASFDRLTGDFFIADVGQSAREEINFQYASSPGGENYGWRLREGTIPTPGAVGGPRPPDNVEPIYDYTHGFDELEGRSVTGGYVYRGPLAGLQGHYFFGDFVSQRLFSLRFDQSDPADFDGTNYDSLIDWTSIVQIDVGSLGGISSFGEDALGHLYLINLGGSVYRFADGNIPEPPKVIASFVYHSSWTGSSSPQWDALDTTKKLAQPGDEPSQLSLENLINSNRGINGIVFDIVGLDNPSEIEWQFTMSPQNSFDEGANPISGWTSAPEPSLITNFSGEGTDGSDRILLQWPDGAIRNRWLRIELTIQDYSATYFLGHLRGETTGTLSNTYTVSFDDISVIRAAVGQSVNASDDRDIDKNGIITFADISAMRASIGSQLTNISIP